GQDTITAPAVPQPASDQPAASAGSPGPAEQEGRVRASPLARRMAADAGIRLASLQGSGPQGRIVKRDVLAARTSAAARPAPVTVATAPSAPPATAVAPAAADTGSARELPHSGMRRTIARRLLESKTTVPHFYLKADCRMDA